MAGRQLINKTKNSSLNTNIQIVTEMIKNIFITFSIRAISS